MEYGIVVAVSEAGAFQIVGACDSLVEAHEMAADYMVVGPETGSLAPSEYQVHRRGNSGAYTVVEHLRYA